MGAGSGTRTARDARASLLFLLLVALKGFLFASAMIATQMHAICTDRSRTERLQRERTGQGCESAWMNVKAMLGPCLSLAWISPFASPQPQRAGGPLGGDPLPCELSHQLLNPPQVFRGDFPRKSPCLVSTDKITSAENKKAQALF